MGVGAKKMTEQMVERISPPKEGRLEISDAICPGLCLRITPAGAKTFSVAYKVPGEGGVSASGRLLVGKQHRITLGAWPIMCLRGPEKRLETYLRKFPMESIHVSRASKPM